MGIDIVTFGCRLNAYESEVMRREAEAAGLGTLAGGAVIVNTCAVTGEAVRQAKQAIRKARRENPDARIVVTGCAAQTDPNGFVAMEEVDLVLGNEEKLKAHNYRALPDFGVNDIEKARAWVWAAQPVTMIWRAGSSRRALRMACLACRTASAVTAQVLTMSASSSPALVASAFMTSDS